MGCCCFVASGLDFDVDRYLASVPFKVVKTFRRGGEPSRPDSGFVVLISQDEDSGLTAQIAAAIKFVAANEAEIVRMRQLGVDNQLFDFGVPRQSVVQQADYLPAELIATMGKLGMGLIFSNIDLHRAVKAN